MGKPGYRLMTAKEALEQMRKWHPPMPTRMQRWKEAIEAELKAKDERIESLEKAQEIRFKEIERLRELNRRMEAANASLRLGGTGVRKP